MGELIMRPTAGDFLINGVRVGTWRETAPGVIHAVTIVGKSKQLETYDAAAASVAGEVSAWLDEINAGRADG